MIHRSSIYKKFYNHKDWKKSERKMKNKNQKFSSIPIFFGFGTTIPNPFWFCFRVFSSRVRFHFGSNRFSSILVFDSSSPFGFLFETDSNRSCCIPNEQFGKYWFWNYKTKQWRFHRFRVITSWNLKSFSFLHVHTFS